jgi:serine/threonine protein kinase
MVGGFELSSQIGEGAFSKVYLGESPDPKVHPLHRQVAIKVIAISAAAGREENKQDYLKKLKKEVRLHKAVTHLNVLRLLQWSEGAGSEALWIILEYCHGGDLFDKISGCPWCLRSACFSVLTRDASHQPPIAASQRISPTCTSSSSWPP